MAETRPVKGYEGLYSVTSDGVIISMPKVVDNGYRVQHRKQKVLKAGVRDGGYLFVVLTKNGESKNLSVHRIVAEAFLPNPENLPEVNHKDENPRNNNVKNLEWCTRQYNIEYSKGKNIIQIDRQTGKEIARYKSIVSASKITGIIRTAIGNACTGLSKSAGGYFWKYCEQ